MRIAKVYIEHPVASLDYPFDYFVVPGQEIYSGVRVEVEFNHRFIVGYVDKVEDSPLTIEEYEQVNGFKINPIMKVIDKEPLLNKELESLAAYLAYVNVAPIISCYQTILPPALKPTSGHKVGVKKLKTVRLGNQNTDGLTKRQKEIVNFFQKNGEYYYKDIESSKSVVDTLISKGNLQVYFKEVYRSPFNEEIILKKRGLPLTVDQQKVIAEINSSMDKFYLLEGVTGSGKTEIYINLTKQYLNDGKTVLILVPEISLTPAMVKRFRERLDEDIAILHSGMSMGEKYDEFRRIIRGEVKVVIGARSAVFAPLENIGLIVMDEEHSESYKQDTVPCYQAIDVINERQRTHNCKVVLGSATPSLESKARAIKGVYHQLYLPHRINNQELPKVEIIDMLVESRNNNYSLFSKRLKDGIENCLKRNEQVILLLNRRGYATSLHCRKCGYIYKCPNCGVALHYHRTDEKLKCHYCGYEISKPERCLECGSTALRTFGIGTQKVEEIIEQQFANAKVIRMDADSTKGKGNHERILNAFENKEYNILLGTQMIAKGLDFPNVTLVGVLNADTSLYCGDFRSNEKTYQLLTQVVGRSGRGALTGEAIIQTLNPSSYAINLAAKQDYELFFKKEMQYRRELLYPPYRYLTTLMFLGNNLDKVYNYACYIKEYIKNEGKDLDLSILGPSEPFIPLVNRKYRMRIMLKYKNVDQVLSLLHEVRKVAVDQKIEIHFDTSPYQDV